MSILRQVPPREWSRSPFCLQRPIGLQEDPHSGVKWSLGSPQPSQAPEVTASQREEGAMSELPGMEKWGRKQRKRRQTQTVCGQRGEDIGLLCRCQVQSEASTRQLWVPTL